MVTMDGGDFMMTKSSIKSLVFTLKYRVFKIPDSGAKNPESGPEQNSGKMLRNPEFPEPEFRTSLGRTMGRVLDSHVPEPNAASKVSLPPQSWSLREISETQPLNFL